MERDYLGAEVITLRSADILSVKADLQTVQSGVALRLPAHSKF